MLATGIDVIEIARIERTLNQHGERFLERIFTPQEILKLHRQPSEVAARFAAKEAVAKTLGVGLRLLSPIGIRWHEVEILNTPSGRPTIALNGYAQSLAQSQNLTEWAISLTHDGGLAIASVVALGR